jgi:hypothetical protein
MRSHNFLFVSRPVVGIPSEDRAMRQPLRKLIVMELSVIFRQKIIRSRNFSVTPESVAEFRIKAREDDASNK